MGAWTSHLVAIAIHTPALPTAAVTLVGPVVALLITGRQILAYTWQAKAHGHTRWVTINAPLCVCVLLCVCLTKELLSRLLLVDTGQLCFTRGIWKEETRDSGNKLQKSAVLWMHLLVWALPLLCTFCFCHDVCYPAVCAFTSTAPVTHH